MKVNIYYCPKSMFGELIGVSYVGTIDKVPTFPNMNGTKEYDEYIKKQVNTHVFDNFKRKIKKEGIHLERDEMYRERYHLEIDEEEISIYLVGLSIWRNLDSQSLLFP